MPDRSTQQTGALSAFAGALLLFVGTLLHPSHAHPNNAAEAFAEYAADQHWVASHLAQLFGVLLLFSALILFARLLTTPLSSTLARVGTLWATASVAAAAALQAVDGIALKAVTGVWVNAAAADRGPAFAAAFGVRQIEIGLASIFGLLGGLTVAIFGAAILAGPRIPRWLGGLAVIGGLLTAAGGLAMAYTGFSDAAMQINMPANAALLVWAIGLGAWMWRRG